MAKRFLAAVIFVPMIIAVVIFGTYVPILFDIAVAIICAVSVFEFVHATKTLRLFAISIPAMIFAVAYPMLITYGFGWLLMYLYAGVMLSMMIFFHRKISFPDFAYVYSMSVVITAALSAIISMKNMDVQHASFYFILALGLPWMADIGAYFAGSFLGRHKMCPEISPKKTVEGAVGGVLLCVGATCLIGWIFADLIYAHTVTVQYLPLCILALIGSLLSILGDLSFSVIKRWFKIKDYGFIIPGHGGFLDRFDSVIFVSPLMLMFITYFPVMIA